MTDDMSNEEEKKEDKFDKFEFDAAGEALGYISLEQARVLAIEHARDNTDFYGSKYQNLQLVWEVVVQEEGEDFYEIRLAYRPVGRFRGQPGVEQFTIEKTGEIRIRQILEEPTRERRRATPLRIGLFVVVAAVVVVAGAIALNEAGREEIGPLETIAEAAVPAAGATEEIGRGFADPQPEEQPRVASARFSGESFFEDFQRGETSFIDLGPNANVRCDVRDCFLSHVARRGEVEPHSTFGDYDWRDYRIEFRFNLDRGGTSFTIAVRENDDGDAYLIVVGDDRLDLKLSLDGNRKTLDSWPISWAAGEWHTLSIKIIGDEIGVVFDDRPFPSYDVSGEGGPLRGRLALHTNSEPQGTVEFWYDDLDLELLDDVLILASGDSFFEDFEGGGPPEAYAVAIGPGADVSCGDDNCFLRHFAGSGRDPFSDFGERSWSDYVLGFRFNVRTDRGGANADFRVDDSGDNYEIYAIPGEGLRLIARKGSVERVVDEIRAPFSRREWHLLQIHAQGTQIKLYLDGRLVASHDVPEDVGPLRGSANVHTHSESRGAVDVWYDDISVDLLEDGVAAAEAEPRREEPATLISDTGKTLVLSEDFEDRDAVEIDLGPAADVICFRNNCVLRHVANRNFEPSSSFGSRSWRDYELRFRFNVRSDGGTASAAIRAGNSGNILLNLISEGLVELSALNNGSEFVIDRIRAPISTEVWHQVRIRARGTFLELYLDGRLVAAHDLPADRVPASGSADVHTHLGLEDPTEVWYDDIRVTLLGEAEARVEPETEPSPITGETVVEKQPTPAAELVTVTDGEEAGIEPETDFPARLIDLRGGDLVIDEDFEDRSRVSVDLMRNSGIDCQGGNCYLIQKAIDGAVAIASFGDTWEGYAFRFRFNLPTGGGPIGPVFRGTQIGEYRVYVAPGLGVELLTVRDERELVVRHIEVPITARDWHSMEVRVDGTRIVLFLDDERIAVQEVPEAPFTEPGPIELRTRSDRGPTEAWYDNIQVVVFEEGEPRILQEVERGEPFGWPEPEEDQRLAFAQDFQASAVGARPNGFAHAGAALRVAADRDGNRYVQLVAGQEDRPFSDLSRGSDDLHFGDARLSDYVLRMRLRIPFEKAGATVVCIRCTTDSGYFLYIDESGRMELGSPQVAGMTGADFGPIGDGEWHHLSFAAIGDRLVVRWDSEIVFEHPDIEPGPGFAMIRLLEPGWHVDDVQLVSIEPAEVVDGQLLEGPDIGFEGFSPTPEQALCALQAVGFEAAGELGSGQRLPTLEEVAAMRHCFPEGFVRTMVAAPSEEFERSTATQRICAFDSVGEDAFLELALGLREATAEEGSHLQQCFDGVSSGSDAGSGGLTRGAIISGHVTDAETGAPIRNVRMVAENAVTGNHMTDDDTDFDGGYSLAGLPSGTYKVKAEGERHGYMRVFYNDRLDGRVADLISINAGETATGIDFLLTPGATISGRVVDAETGFPVSDVQVWAGPLFEGNWQDDRTDFDGRYTIKGVAPGTYRLEARAQQMGYMDVYFPDTTLKETAEVITVDGGDEISGLDFFLRTGASISGRVVDARTGAPISDIEIGADPDFQGNWNGANTDFDGRYTLTGLAPGSYRIVARAQNVGYIEVYYRDTTLWENAELVTVGEKDEISGLDFSLRTGSTITGRVIDAATGQPVFGVGINADPEFGGPGAWDDTDLDGGYTLSGLAPGLYRIRAEGQNRGYYEVYFDGRLRWDDADLVSVGEEDFVDGIDFALNIGSTISGRVMDEETGLPIGGVDVSADNRFDGPGAWTETDFEGRYVLQGVAPGSYVIRANGRDYGYVEIFYDDKPSWDAADVITVFEQDAVTGIDFLLSAGATISGRMTDAATGLGVAGVEVNADRKDEGGRGSGSRTQFDGSYTITGLSPGRYVVKAAYGGRLGYVQQYYSGELSWDDANVVIVGEDAVTDIDFVLKPGGSISGRVTDASTGLGISGMDVHAGLVDTGGEHAAWESTDTNGDYTLRGLPEGRIGIFVSGRGFVEVSRTVFLSEGEHITGFDF